MFFASIRRVSNEDQAVSIQYGFSMGSKEVHVAKYIDVRLHSPHEQQRFDTSEFWSDECIYPLVLFVSACTVVAVSAIRVSDAFVEGLAQRHGIH